MKTSHRAQSQAKRRIADPMSSVYVLSMNEVMSQADADRTMVLVRVAFERMKSGGSDDYFDRLSGALNCALIRSEKIDAMLVEIINRGLQAMIESDRIRLKHGRYGFTGPGLLAVVDSLDAYEVILRASTYKEMFDASIEVGERLRKGQFTEALV